MNDLILLLETALTAMSAWEMLAVILAIGYLLLATRESLWCWYCALASTAIYTAIFWNVSLLMESALNVYYMVMAVYGWWQWRQGGQQHEGVQVHRWSPTQHAITFVIIVVLTLVSGFLLERNTGAAWPYLDSFTTWASVITTWMVAQKVLENWLYWIVIDSVSIGLYADRGLYLTALLFVAYVIIAIYGYSAWRRHEQQLPVAA